MHQNIQSIRNKTLDIECLIDGLASKPSLLMFSEHWMRPGEKDFVRLNGYKLVSCYCRAAMEHGGTCIYSSELLAFRQESTVCEKSVEGVLEMACAVEDQLKVVVVCVYRRGLGSYDIFLETLEDTLNFLIQKYIKYKIVIGGDFNIDLFETSHVTKRFLDLMHVFSLSQCIFKATRINQMSSTLIDNIFCNLSCDFDGYVLNTALSDHHAQVLSFEINSIQNEPKLLHKRFFSSNRVQFFKHELSGVDWTQIYWSSSVDTAYNIFLNLFKNLFDKIFIAKKCLVSKKANSWITKGIKKSCIHKRVLFYKKKNKGLISVQFFNNYCSILKKVIKKAKQMSSTNFINRAENKVKATWQIVKQTTGQTSGRVSVLESFSPKYNDPVKIVNNLNNYFINSCPNVDNDQSNKTYPINRIVHSIYLTPVEPKETLRVIGNLKNKQSVGDDEIPVSVLKEVSNIIAEPLTFILNLCLSTGRFPEQLKNALIKTVYKKGERDDEKNYRPISLLPNISKIFETIISCRFVSFLERHSVISDRQNAFRGGKSTIRAIYQSLIKIVESLNVKQQTLALCLDLSKAFDSVDHDGLIVKLERYGIRGNALSLIRSYLGNRTQRVVEYDTEGRLIKSERAKVNRGVPQGSILGPLLYIMYTNELPCVSGEHTVLYADDASLVFSECDGSLLAERVQMVMGTVDEYFKTNNLFMNVPKTQCILFGNRGENKNFTFVYNAESITSQKSVSFLGVHIDARLDWRVHIEKVSTKIAQYCFALKIVAERVGLQAALSAYHAFIQSRIRYGLIFWGNSCDIDRVFILQKRCLRTIFKMNKRESCRDVFIENNILTVICMYILDCVLFVSKNGDLFEDSTLNHKYCTRNKANLVSNKYNFSYLQKNVEYSIKKVFNSLPEGIRNLSGNRFRIVLKKILCQKAFYTMEEFYDCDKSAWFG